MNANANDAYRDNRTGENGAPFKSLTGAVSNAVQQDILTAKFLPGEKLPIVHLARDYGVSPGAIREALSRLISEGLVVFNEQRGFRAAPVSPAALMDITRTRIMIDAHGLREAIRQGDSDWVSDVRKQQQRLASCQQRESNSAKMRQEWLRLHRDFHRALIAASGSEWLMHFHDRLFDQTVRYRAVAAIYELNNESRRANAEMEHAQIVEAIAARDPDAAAQLIERHYMGTAELIINAPEIDRSQEPKD
jgi:GntR family carbon starvation induced transcriptional regulator